MRDVFCGVSVQEPCKGYPGFSKVIRTKCTCVVGSLEKISKQRKQRTLDITEQHAYFPNFSRSDQKIRKIRNKKKINARFYAFLCIQYVAIVSLRSATFVGIWYIL